MIRFAIACRFVELIELAKKIVDRGDRGRRVVEADVAWETANDRRHGFGVNTFRRSETERSQVRSTETEVPVIAGYINTPGYYIFTQRAPRIIS